MLACVGWSAANAIVGAQFIHAVNTDVPGFAGILIIVICTLFITFTGGPCILVLELDPYVHRLHNCLDEVRSLG